MGGNMKSKKIRSVRIYLQNLVSPKRYAPVITWPIIIATVAIGLGVETVSQSKHLAIWGATSTSWKETCIRTIESICEEAYTFGNCNDQIVQHCGIDTSFDDRSHGVHSQEWIEWSHPEFRNFSLNSPTNKIQGVWRSPSVGWISCRPFLGMGCGDWANREFRLYIVQHFWGMPASYSRDSSCYQGMVTTDIHSDPNFFNDRDYQDLAHYCRGALARRR